jgi:NAD(P)-dependent dehydrogenase (short-subunit alcohol dehydrogenase family)
VASETSFGEIKRLIERRATMTINHTQSRSAILIIGASSGVAHAIVSHLRLRNHSSIYTVSRSTMKAQVGVVSIESDYSQGSIEKICEQLKAEDVDITHVFICNGLLHDAEVFPEKQLREFTQEKWMATMHVNALVPMMWIQAIAAILPSKAHCLFTVFSARVGSISDNRLGGWYSYRSSKAALNMLVKTASLEMKRTHPNVSFLLFHPGTMDTPLSEPFQQRVPKEKLFTPEFVAERLLDLLEDNAEEGTLRYLDWAGKPIDF